MSKAKREVWVIEVDGVPTRTTDEEATARFWCKPNSNERVIKYVPEVPAPSPRKRRKNK